MKLKKLEQIVVDGVTFKIKYFETVFAGGNISIKDKEINIGTGGGDEMTLQAINHELFELCCMNANVRFTSGHSDYEYLFSFNHGQFTQILDAFTGLQKQFIC